MRVFGGNFCYVVVVVVVVPKDTHRVIGDGLAEEVFDASIRAGQMSIKSFSSIVTLILFIINQSVLMPVA